MLDIIRDIELTHFKYEAIDAFVGMSSLVGFFSDGFPMTRGNYCDIGDYYALNMWAENFEHLKSKGQPLEGAEVVLALVNKKARLAILVDERIPKDYLNHTPCFTGSGSGSLPEGGHKEIYQIMCPEWQPEKGCLCLPENDYKSVEWWSKNFQTGDYKGRCNICNQDTSKQVTPTYTTGHIVLPYTVKTTVAEVESMVSIDIKKEFLDMLDGDEEKLAELMKRYGKPVNPKFYRKTGMNPDGTSFTILPD